MQAVDSIIAILGVTNEEANFLLEISGGDLEGAISMYYSKDGD